MHTSFKCRRGAAGHTTATVISVLLASTALVIAVCREPLQPGFALRNPAGDPLDNYQFDTPATTAKSLMLMELNKDFRARMEYESRMDKKNLEDRLNTFKVEREETFQREKGPAKKYYDGTGEYRILFVSFTQNGEPFKQVVSMEKDPSGYWKRSYLSPYDVRTSNKQLADDMEEWEANKRS